MNKKELNAFKEMKDKLKDARAIKGDPEVSHKDADEALLDFFDTIDPEIRIIFEGVQKYYA